MNSQIVDVIASADAHPWGRGFIAFFENEDDACVVAQMIDEALDGALDEYDYTCPVEGSSPVEPSKKGWVLESMVAGDSYQPIFSGEGVHFLQGVGVNLCIEPENPDNLDPPPVWQW